MDQGRADAEWSATSKVGPPAPNSLPQLLGTALIAALHERVICPRRLEAHYRQVNDRDGSEEPANDVDAMLGSLPQQRHDMEAAMTPDNLRVGFIGIGKMGSPMAGNILRAGFPLTIYDRNPGKMKPLVDAGAQAAEDAAAVAEESDLVITMIGTVKDELAVVMGERGVLAGAHPDLTLIDMSTVGVATSRKLAAAAEEKGVSFLDAPVSGSVGPATEGSLGIMVGGDAEVLERGRPVFEALGDRIDHMGPNGTGSAMKVVLNLMIGMTVLAVAETVHLGQQAGLDPDKMLDILGRSSVRSPHLEAKGRMMIERRFEPAFALKYMQKDFDLVMESAQELRTPLFASAIVHQVYSAANVSGYGELDYAGVIRFLEDAAGVADRER